MAKILARASIEERVAVFAITHLGYPYEFGGDGSPGKGLDCSQLVVNVFNMLGFAVEDMNSEQLRTNFFTLYKEPDVGPVVKAIFRVGKTGVNHIGLCGPSGDTVIHATKQDGRVVLKSLESILYDETMWLDFRALMPYLKIIRDVPPPRQPNLPGGER
jgi:cell wall-associated NlpC family hydrolase